VFQQFDKAAKSDYLTKSEALQALRVRDKEVAQLKDSLFVMQRAIDALRLDLEAVVAGLGGELKTEPMIPAKRVFKPGPPF
jgi:hypothetical protein